MTKANIMSDENMLLRDKILQKPVVTLTELFTLPPRPNDYMIENLLWENQAVIILAKDKVGKSIFTKQMCCSLSNGTPFLGAFDVARKFKVLYIQLEGDVDETKDRLISMVNKVPTDTNNFMFKYIPKIHLNVEEDVVKLCAEIDSFEHKPEVIVLDPIYMAKKGSLSNDEVVGDMLSNINIIKWRYKCSILMVNHEHKAKRTSEGFEIEEGDDSIMGSSLFKNYANHVIRLKVEKKKGVVSEDCNRLLTCSTQRNGSVVKDLVLKLNADPLYFYIQQETKSGFEETYLNLLKTLDKFSSKDLIALTNISESMSRKVFSKLLENGKIKKLKVENRIVYYQTT